MQNKSPKNPRITITLKPSLYNALIRYSSISGSSISGVISELLEDAEPVLSRLCAVMEAAKSAEGELKSVLKDGLSVTEENLKNQLDTVMAELSDAGDLFTEIEKVAIRRRKAKKSVRATGSEGQG